VYRVVTDHSAADCHVPTPNEDAHEGTDPDGHAHPADRHTYCHRDGHPGSVDGDADPAHADAPAGDGYGMCCQL
jgi:hypothetical protein